MTWKQKFEEFVKAEQIVETAEHIVYHNVDVIKGIGFWAAGMKFKSVIVNKKVEPYEVAFVTQHVLSIEFPEEKSKKEEEQSDENAD